MSSEDEMTPSANRKPAASSRSEPGVRMMTAKGRPWRRTSSGSSTAAASSPAPAGPRPILVTGTRRTVSDMVAEHQLARMRFQIDLPGEIRHVERADVVPDEGDGHDERYQSAAVLVD